MPTDIGYVTLKAGTKWTFVLPHMTESRFIYGGMSLYMVVCVCLCGSTSIDLPPKR